MNTAFYRLSAEETVKFLGVELKTGLGQQEVLQRLARFGPNQLKEKKKISPLFIFLEQFKNFIIWVLIGAALVSGFLGEWVDAFAIVAIVVLNAVLGFVQEYRAEKSLAALKKLASPAAKVIRESVRKTIPAAQLVPGDLIELEAGDNVPADCRLVYVSANFFTQEASLTGESAPVAKTVLALPEKEIALADRANMVYAGTAVVSGRGRGVVTYTGMQTELGHIAGMIQQIEDETTPLQKRLEQFGRWIVYLCFVLVLMVFGLEFLRGGEILEVFLTAVSLAVAAIPEGLPAVVTIALAMGVQRMVRRHALIRKLPAVETLGSATVICSDKTGTLTKNEMTVKTVFADGTLFEVSGTGYEPKGDFLLEEKGVALVDHPVLKKVLLAGILCNSAELVQVKDAWQIAGDPTEGAILTAAAKLGLWKEKTEKDFPFVEEIPFDAVRKKMTVVCRQGEGFAAFVKGAPDVLLNACTAIEEKGEIKAIDNHTREKILAANAGLAAKAMRVLAVAYKKFDRPPASYEAKEIEKDLCFLGLVAMIDPPREEVKTAVAECETAGIRTVMITGDHKNTAVAIGRELGIFKEGSLALSGEELDRLSEREFYDKVAVTSVYGRVSPEHKLRIVSCLRRQGEIVAMTGDGVNDAPAVKEADIGVAMGITGTDVTKEVSDMVITDDNFASIVAAVEEGRGIYDNIKKFVHYLLSCNVGEILVMFVASLLGFPVPLLPIHILWVNLVTDGFPALALGIDPVDPQIMKKPPRPPKEPVITGRQGVTMLLQGAFIAFCSLLAFAFVLFVEQEDMGRARTAAFIVLSCSQLFHAFNCRSQTVSLFKLGIFSNRNLVLAVLASFLLQISAVSLPFLQPIFKTELLTLFDWVLVVLLSSFPLWAMEAIKILRAKRIFDVL